jgi:hypothetical protein
MRIFRSEGSRLDSPVRRRAASQLWVGKFGGFVGLKGRHRRWFSPLLGCRDGSRDVTQSCAAKQLRSELSSLDPSGLCKNAPPPPISRRGGAFCRRTKTTKMNLSHDNTTIYAKQSAGVGAYGCTTRPAPRTVAGEDWAMSQLGHEVTSNVTCATQHNDLRRRAISSYEVDLLPRNDLRQRDRAAEVDVTRKCHFEVRDIRSEAAASVVPPLVATNSRRTLAGGGFPARSYFAPCPDVPR